MLDPLGRLQGGARTAVPDPDSIRAAFHEVVGRPEFRQDDSSLLGRWLGPALDFLSDLIDSLFPDLGPNELHPVRLALLAVLAVAAAILLTRWLRRRAGGRNTDPGTVPPPATRDAAGWRRWSRRTASEGRLREAATGLYRAVVLDLHARGVLRQGDWKTPGDYLQEVNADAPVRGPLQAFFGRFVEVAFGPAEPTSESFEALDRWADRLGCPT